MSNQHLFLFQIGPVQSFIAAARKTQDLYVGSRLLSVLASAGVEAAHQAGGSLLFPVITRGEAPATTPHRFAFLSADEPEGVAEFAARAIQDRWAAITNAAGDYLFRAVGGGDWVDIYQRQAQSWLEIHWVAVPYAGQHGEAFRRAGQALAMRRLSRTFTQPGDDAPDTKKCTLTGAGRALPLDWDVLRAAIGDTEGKLIRPNEALGALAVIKRLAQNVKPVRDLLGDAIVRFPDADSIAGRQGERGAGRGKEVESYLAILHMDGDRMGQHLAGLTKAEEHQAFSAMLSTFAEETVPAIVGKYPPAQLVYAGGDDVLALAPLGCVLDLADEIRRAFEAATAALHQGKPLRMSAGIAAAPSNLPFDAALNDARQAEKTAKTTYDRNAVVIRETHRSGQIREAGAKWESLDPVTQLRVLFSDDALSGKLGYDLLTEAQWLAGDDLAKARQAEIGRLLKRRTDDGATPANKEAIRELGVPLAGLGEQRGWEAMANWVIVAHFLAKGGAR